MTDLEELFWTASNHRDACKQLEGKTELFPEDLVWIKQKKSLENSHAWKRIKLLDEILFLREAATPFAAVMRIFDHLEANYGQTRANLLRLTVGEVIEIINKEKLLRPQDTLVNNETQSLPANPSNATPPKSATDNIFRPAKEFLCDEFPTYKALNKALDKNQIIRRNKPSRNRLEIHIGDWFAFLADYRKTSDKAKAQVETDQASIVESYAKEYAKKKGKK